MHGREVNFRAGFNVPRLREGNVAGPAQFHELADGNVAKKNPPMGRAQGVADGCLALHKIVPQIGVIRDERELRGQAEVMAVIRQQPDAKTVDRAKEDAVERGDHVERHPCVQNLLASPALHFIGGAMSEGDDHQVRQPP